MKEVTITLTGTQYSTLMLALAELNELELNSSCSDAYEDDKFYSLSKEERRVAKRNMGAIYNTTATAYLIHILSL